MYALNRKFSDRRSGKDRRRAFGLRRLHYKGPERREMMQKDRRSPQERRAGYVKVDKWSSVKLKNLKLAKYLRLH